MHTYRDTNKVWKKVQKIKKQKRPRPTALKVDNKMIVDDAEKAEIFADTLAGNSQNHTLPEKFRKQRENTKFTEPLHDNSKDFNREILFSELKAAVNHVGSQDKAAGIDMVSYPMIAHLPDSFLRIILTIFNELFAQDIVPQVWKEATVITLHKEGKPRHDPTSYRPISLTSHLGKIYERIINERLVLFLEINNIIPHEQAGFRRFRSTTEHITSVVEMMKTTLLEKNTRRLAVFFDISKAFDRVWHGLLLSKLKNYGISGHLYKFIQNFLSNRKMRVRSGNKLSTPRTLDMGVPQGSVIAPTLFLVMLADIIQKVDPKDSLLKNFADDLSLISKEFQKGNCASNIESFQNQVDKIAGYLSDISLELSAPKSQLMVVGRGSIKFDDHSYNIRIGQTILEPQKQVKFLGIILHFRLDWSPHINMLAQKANKTINLIKILSAIPWLKGTKVLTNIVLALVRTKLTYGQEAFGTDLLPKLAKILDVVDRRALKIALGVPIWAKTELINSTAGVASLHDQREVARANFLVRLQTLRSMSKETTFDLIQKSCARTEKQKARIRFEKNHPKRKSLDHLNPIFSVPDATKGEIQANPLLQNVDLNNIEQFKQPDKLYSQHKAPNFIYSIPKGCTKNQNPNTVKTAAQITVEETLGDSIHLYTDGSRLTNGATASGLYINHRKHGDGKETKFSIRLRDNHSIFTAEMWALRAAAWSAREIGRSYRQKGELPSIAIITDSKSCMQALQSRAKSRFSEHNAIIKDMDELVSHNHKVTIAHVPSHMGIRGNDIADELASSKAKEELGSDQIWSLGYTREEVKSMIRAKANEILPSYRAKRQYRRPSMQPGPLRIYHRLKTHGTAFQGPFKREYTCHCGDMLSPSHALVCPLHQALGTKLKQTLDKYKLPDMAAALEHHPEHGFKPACEVCTTLHGSEISYVL